MAGILSILAMILGLVAFVCYVIVIIKMFQHGQTGLAIACIVLFFCIIGYFIALVYGWMKAKEWNIQNVMMIWTICLVIGLLINFVAVPMMGGPAPFQVPGELPA